jgi:hypothetical protein
VRAGQIHSKNSGLNETIASGQNLKNAANTCQCAVDGGGFETQILSGAFARRPA